jgi:hypothetical protein
MFAVMKMFVTDISASTETWKGETWYMYKLPCQSHISNIKSFLPVEAEISVTNIFITDYHYTPTRREGAILQSPCPSVHTFVKDVSAATGRNDFIFDT